MELQAISSFIAESTSDETTIVGLQTVLACINKNQNSANLFRESGLVNVIIELLNKTVNQLVAIINSHPVKQNKDKITVLSLLLEICRLLVIGPNIENCQRFNDLGGVRSMFALLSISHTELFQTSMPIRAKSLSSDDSSAFSTQDSYQSSPNPQTSSPCYSSQIELTQSTCSPQTQASQTHFQSSLSSKQVHKSSLLILRQLILSTTCDEHLTSLLCFLSRSLNLDSSILSSILTRHTDESSNDQSEYNSTKQSIKSVQSQTSFYSFVSLEIGLKISILKSLVILMKENHRFRTLFRKANGFMYIVSTLSVLENSLLKQNQTLDLDKNDQSSFLDEEGYNSRKIWRLIKNCFTTIVAAMRNEPANIRAFSDDVLERFTDSLLKLGCFNINQTDMIQKSNIGRGEWSLYRDIFLAAPTRDFSNVVDKSSTRPSLASCQLLRFLYDMSINYYDSTKELESAFSYSFSKHDVNFNKSISFEQPVLSNIDTSDTSSIRLLNEPPNISTPLNSSSQNRLTSSESSEKLKQKLVVTYPCVVIAMLDLLPSCKSDELIEFTLEVIKYLLKSERNQQLLAEYGLISKLLSNKWNIALIDEKHFLHLPCKTILEKLSSHYITAKELRSFLRLGEPLRCKHLDEIPLFPSNELQKLPEKPVNEIPIKRIETFVSMLSREGVNIEPSFVEFDMSFGNLATIFLPSIAPVNSKSLPVKQNSDFFRNTLDLHSSEKNGLLGGVGINERAFPPKNGFSLSSWIRIDKFPSRTPDQTQDIKLVNIYRGIAATGQEFTCFRCLISALDRSILISTQELPYNTGDDQFANQPLDPDSNLRISIPGLLVEGCWHHLAITMSRSALKQSVINVYLDGQLVCNQRVNYISSFVGVSSNAARIAQMSSMNTMSSSIAAYVNMFIGNQPHCRIASQTVWRQGLFHIVEETLSADLVYSLYSLGPNYIGNYQCPTKLIELAKRRTPVAKVAHQSLKSSQSNSASHVSKFAIAEDKIMVSIDSRASSLMTMSRMRRIYTKFDCRQVLRVFGSVTSESSTPLMLLHNTAIHLSGPSRTIGAVSIGFDSVRYFVPNPTRVVIYNVGGPYLILALVAQARTCESLYQSVKAVVYALGGNLQLQNQMLSINGYQTLALMLRDKESLLSEEILRLLFALINDNIRHQAQPATFLSLNKQKTTSEIIIVEALQELICEMFDLWLQAGLLPVVLEYLHDLIKSQHNATQENKESSNQLQQSINSSGKRASTLLINLNTDTTLIKAKNLKTLRELDLLPRLLILLRTQKSTANQSDLNKESMSSEPQNSKINEFDEQFQCDLVQTSASNNEDTSEDYSTDSSPLKCVRMVDDSNISNENDADSSYYSLKQFDLQTVYTIRQIVYELLNKTPRQSDILNFGQFLASLLPQCKDHKHHSIISVKDKTRFTYHSQSIVEREKGIIDLRNSLLKSVTQLLMVNNNRADINSAMQEEFVKILGFDWFMLFINCNKNQPLDKETIKIGFSNLMIILSNSELYKNFTRYNNQTTQLQTQNSLPNHGGWLKQPSFLTLDNHSSVQMLGLSVGIFFGHKSRIKSIKQEMLSAPSLYLLTNCLLNLTSMPQIYLMLFQTMMNKFSNFEQSTVQTIETFTHLNFDNLCDSLVGDTHHKRRLALTNLKFKCKDLIVCIVYMIKELFFLLSCSQSAALKRKINEYPNHLIKFLMYFYNNHKQVQEFCKNSDDLIEALAETLMQPESLTSGNNCESDYCTNDSIQIVKYFFESPQAMVKHSASKELLEFSRLIILDALTDLESNNSLIHFTDFEAATSNQRLRNQKSSSQSSLSNAAIGGGNSSTNTNIGHKTALYSLEKFLKASSACKETQEEFIECLLKQILLLVDSMARHNTVQTISSCSNIAQFQVLLAKSILITDLITEKIWLKELFVDDLTRISSILKDFLTLTEQVFKFNEILPRTNPPQAFMMQRVVDRMILFALSRPYVHVSDRHVLLNLLKTIYNHRTLIILNHTQDAHSTEFFVCLTYCILNLMDENSAYNVGLNNQRNTARSAMRSESFTHSIDESPSIILLASEAKKLWDVVYQSKRDTLSEAFSVSMSLAAFTLETSVDLLKLKPNIIDTCQKYWSNFVANEQNINSKQRTKFLPLKKAESPSTTASSAANILTNKLTRVVNAASFVSRVVGATAGSVASNVASSAASGEKLLLGKRSDSFVGGMKSSPDLSASRQSIVNTSTSIDDQSSSSLLSCLSANCLSPFKCSNVNRYEIERAMLTHISVCEDYMQSQSLQTNQKLAVSKYLCDKWLEIEFENLLRERAVFGPNYASLKFDKWCLDLTEGPKRMRKKTQNYTRQFYLAYPYRPPADPSKMRPPRCFDSLTYTLKSKQLPSHIFVSMNNKDSSEFSVLEIYAHDLSFAIQEVKEGRDIKQQVVSRASLKTTMSSKSVNLNPKTATNNDTKSSDSNVKVKVTSVMLPPQLSPDVESPNQKIKISPQKRTDSLGNQQTIEGVTLYSKSIDGFKYLSIAPNSKQATSSGQSSPILNEDFNSASFVDFGSEIEDEASLAHDSENNDSLTVLRLLEKNEQISHMFRCSRVQGLDTYEGLLLFGKDYFYLIDGFTLLKTREIKDIDSLPPDAHDPIIPTSSPIQDSPRSPNEFQVNVENSKVDKQHLPTVNDSDLKVLDNETISSSPSGTSKALNEVKVQNKAQPPRPPPPFKDGSPNKKTCSKFSYDSVVEVHKRRYLLHPIALEVFCYDGRNCLIVFPRNIRNKVYARFIDVTNQNTNQNVSDSLAGQKLSVNVETSSNLLSSLIGETSVTQRWVNGDISNFQYLMNLNTISGRSYNDLMQYPIFPWILADYTSEELDLTNKATFRDLSLPIGAQTSQRLKQFTDRFRDWDKEQTGVPPYHYGTFYSSAMIVASFLVRIDPFTQHFLRLQGGNFDLADRMFNSIHGAWLSASQNNMADVKELIPEFFYLPEFLTNSSKFDFGSKQTGELINDVELPPWAKNDPREFIRIHRAALECDYVSAHLHEWIDLIFGYKQQGQPAIDSYNTFHHLFYEGNVDIYNKDIEPIKRNAVIGFIDNFGQVPKQLFKKPHPMKKVSQSVINSFQGVKTAQARNNSPVSFLVNALPNALTANVSSSSSSTQSSSSKQSSNFSQQHCSSQQYQQQQQQQYQYQRTCFMQCPGLLRQTANVQYKELRGPVGQIVQQESQKNNINICAVEQNKMLIPPDFNRYIAWGYADRSLRLCSFDSEKPIFIWESCDSVAPSDILCCTIPNNRIMVTAGTDSILTVWSIEKMSRICPKQNLYGHVEPVTCLASSATYSILISGSRDRTCIVWNLNKFTFVRQLGLCLETGKPLHCAPISAIAINDSSGDIATCAASYLYLWSVNGDLIASVDTSLASCFNYQPAMQTTNASFGRSMFSSGRVHILSVTMSSQTDWSDDEVIVIGASDGSVTLWSVRFRQLQRRSIAGARKCVSAIKQQQPLDIKMQQQDNNEIEQEANDDAKKQINNNINQEQEEETTVQATSEPRQIPQSSSPTTAGSNRRTRLNDSNSSDWVKVSSSLCSENSSIDAISHPLSNQHQTHSLASASDTNDGAGFVAPVSQRFSSTPTKRASLLDEHLVDVARSPGSCKSSLFSALNDDYEAGIGNQSVASPSATPLVEESFVVFDDNFGDASSPSHDEQNINDSKIPDEQTQRNLEFEQQHQQSRLETITEATVVTANKLIQDVDTSAQNSRTPKSTDEQSIVEKIDQPQSEHQQKVWYRELFLRTQLNRRSLPANSGNKQLLSPVTALTISKDHKSIFVGDASGRITSFTV